MEKQIKESLEHLLEGFFLSCEYGTYSEKEEMSVYIRTTFQKGNGSLTCGLCSQETLARLATKHEIKAHVMITSLSDQTLVIKQLMEQL